MAFDPTPPVNCKYGAPMGRASHNAYTVTEGAKPFRLVKCPLDSGGYDRGGAYWGLGDPLYFYEGPLTDINGYVRGKTRDAAKVEVRKIHPKARFFDGDGGPLHVDYTLSIQELPADCIKDCSERGDVSAPVAQWRAALRFTVDRDRALQCLQGYGAWEAAELAELSDSDVADKVLWLACCDFSEFIAHCKRKGVDPFAGKDIETPSGSDVFVLE